MFESLLAYSICPSETNVSDVPEGRNVPHQRELATSMGPGAKRGSHLLHFCNTVAAGTVRLRLKAPATPIRRGSINFTQILSGIRMRESMSFEWDGSIPEPRVRLPL